MLDTAFLGMNIRQRRAMVILKIFKVLMKYLFYIGIGFLIGSCIQWKCIRLEARNTRTRSKSLLVGIMIHDEQLEIRVRAVRETFGQRQDLADIMFFLADKNASVTRVNTLYGFSTVYLSGVDRREYPPQKKMYEMMKYLYRNYLHQYQWFARVDYDAYINLERLKAFLLSLDSNRMWYIGKKGMGRRHEIGKLGLPSGYEYCMGGSGVFLSRGSLAKLGPHLDTCKRQRFTLHEDTELARCIQLYLNISCSSANLNTTGWNILPASQTKRSNQVVQLFHHEYTKENDHQSFERILTTTGKIVLTFHPLKQLGNFYQMHHAILRENLNFRMLQSNQLRQEIKDTETLLQQRKVLIKPRWYFLLDRLQEQFAAESYQPNSLGETMADHAFYWAEVNGTRLTSLRNPYEFLQLDLFFQRRNVAYELLQKAIQNYCQTEDTKCKVMLDSVYRKLAPNYGLFFQFPVINRDGSSKVHGVVHSVLKFEPIIFLNESTENIQSKSMEKINIIVPLFKRTQEIKRFVGKISAMDKSKIGSLHFVFATYKDTDASLKRTIQAIQLLDSLQPEVTYQCLLLNGTFSRAAAINEGAAVIQSGLLFIVDIDILLYEDVFRRVRRNTLRGESMYFPIVFNRFFDACANESECAHEQFTHLNDVFGFWRYFGNGMLAIYKSDFTKLGSLNAKTKEWGGEDIEFLEKCLSSKDHSVFQSIDPGLIHVYHAKNCSDIQSLDKRSQCYSSRSMTFASTVSLAKNILVIPEIINKDN